MVASFNGELLNLAAELQKYQHMDNITLDVPQFILLGTQSIGKTRLLSCIAGCKLGGAEQKGTGTRCPVVYKFSRQEDCQELRFSMGTSPEDLKVKEQSEVSVILTEHMASLGQSESPGSGGFSTKPYFVQVEGQSVPSFTVIDLPGLKKDDPCNRAFVISSNHEILKMYEQFYDSGNTVPVILTQFDTSLDFEHTISGFNTFLTEARVPSRLMKKALVFVSRLDAVRDMEKEHVIKFLEHLAENKGFPKERVMFATLRPELIGQGCAEQMMDSDTYFREVRAELELKHLTPWIQKVGLDDAGCKFGFAPLKDQVESDLITTMKTQSPRILAALRARLREEVLEARALVKTSQKMNRDELGSQLQDYVDLFASSLIGATQRDARRFLDKRLAAIEKNYGPRCLKIAENKICEKILNGTRRTFPQEEEENQHWLQSMETSWLLCEETREALEPPAAGQVPSNLRPDVPLGGSSAVKRLLQRQGVAVLTKNLRTFDEYEILDLMGGDVKLDHVISSSDTAGVLRKMVEMVKPSHQQTRILCKWCMDIYGSQVPVIRKILQSNVALLGEHPKLRAFVDDCIWQQYTEALESMTNEAIERIALLYENKFTFLNPEDVWRIKMLAEFTLQDECRPSEVPRAERVLNRMPSFDNDSQDEIIQDRVTMALNLVNGNAAGSKEGIVEHLNSAAHEVARMNLGLAWLESNTIIYELFEQRVMQIPHDIPRALAAITVRLLSEGPDGLLSKLVGLDASSQKQMNHCLANLEALSNDIESFCAAPLETLDKSTLKAAAIDVAEGRKLLAQLESCMEHLPKASTEEDFDIEEMILSFHKELQMASCPSDQAPEETLRIQALQAQLIQERSRNAELEQQIEALQQSLDKSAGA